MAKNNSLHVQRSSVHFAPSEVIPDSKLTDPSKFCDVEGNPNDVGPHDTVLPFSADMYRLFSEQQNRIQEETVFALRTLTPKRIDLLELCAP